MNSETASLFTSQSIYLKDKKQLEITGIKKIESLNSEEFLIDTSLGMLLVRGSDLQMTQLDIDKGNLWISGTINLIEYLENTKKEKTGFFSKVFK